MTDLAAQHARALDRARNRDSKWFRARPFAHLRVREALPFEQILGGRSGHITNPFVVIMLNEERTGCERIFFFADRMPNADHASLTALWDTLEKMAERNAGKAGIVLATPEELLSGKAEAVALQLMFPNSIHRLGVRS